ncbi:MAG: hypothetical protein MRZ79_03525 [Bacteroidia bacterium]|nr:hypothetical protein [Bacteroidia bacterium]
MKQLILPLAVFLFGISGLLFAQPLVRTYDSFGSSKPQNPVFSNPLSCVSPLSLDYFCGWRSWDNTVSGDPGQYFDGIQGAGNPVDMKIDVNSGRMKFTLPGYSGPSNPSPISNWRILEIFGDGTYNIASGALGSSGTGYIGSAHTYPFYTKANGRSSESNMKNGAYIMETYIPPLKPPRGFMAVDIDLEYRGTPLNYVSFQQAGQSTHDPFLNGPSGNIFFESALNPAKGSRMILCISYKDNDPNRTNDKISLLLDRDVFVVKGLLSYFGEELVSINAQPNISGNLPFFGNPILLEIDLFRKEKKMEGLKDDGSTVIYSPENKTVYLELAIKQEIELESTNILAVYKPSETGDRLEWGSYGRENEYSESYSLLEAHDPNAIILPLDELAPLDSNNSIEPGIPYFDSTQCRELNYTVKFENDGQAVEQNVEITIPIPEGWDKNYIELDSWYAPHISSNICNNDNICFKKHFVQGTGSNQSRNCDELVFTLSNLRLRGTNEAGNVPLDSCRGWVKFKTRTVHLDNPTNQSLRTYADIVFMSVNGSLRTNLSSPNFINLGTPTWPLAISGRVVGDTTYTKDCDIQEFICEPVCTGLWCNVDFNVLAPIGLAVLVVLVVIIVGIRRRRKNTLSQ